VTAWDALLAAADRLDACPSAEVVAAREVIARAVEHARTCSTCLPDPRLIADLTALLGVDGDEQLDAAAVEIAVELDHRLTTHQVQPSSGFLTCGVSTQVHRVAQRTKIGRIWP
jgi:hypothetical protein